MRERTTGYRWCKDIKDEVGIHSLSWHCSDDEHASRYVHAVRSAHVRIANPDPGCAMVGALQTQFPFRLTTMLIYATVVNVSNLDRRDRSDMLIPE